MSDDILQRLMTVLRARKEADPSTSYVAGLYQQGLDAILQKIGEESTETILAAKSGDRSQIVPLLSHVGAARHRCSAGAG